MALGRLHRPPAATPAIATGTIIEWDNAGALRVPAPIGVHTEPSIDSRPEAQCFRPLFIGAARRPSLTVALPNGIVSTLRRTRPTAGPMGQTNGDEKTWRRPPPAAAALLSRGAGACSVTGPQAWRNGRCRGRHGRTIRMARPTARLKAGTAMPPRPVREEPACQILEGPTGPFRHERGRLRSQWLGRMQEAVLSGEATGMG